MTILRLYKRMIIEGNRLSENSNMTDKVIAGRLGKGVEYKWIALFNVTLAPLMGSQLTIALF